MYYLIKQESFKGGGKEKQNKIWNSFLQFAAICLKQNLMFKKLLPLNRYPVVGADLPGEPNFNCNH